jgi:hypothetical protein
MTRKEKLLAGLNIAQSIGAEIGPLHNALVDKSEGSIFYVDHCDTEALKARWSSDPSVDLGKLHVDAVWGTRTLKEAIGESAFAREIGLDKQELDYVVASHVVEHVPDLVTWFVEIEAVLKREGTVRLAVPDKRYTFDYLRRTSSITDVADAFVRKRRVPSGNRVLDFAFNMVHVDCAKAWAREIDRTGLVHGYTLSQALKLAEDAESNGTYHDVHCWVFTPMSFTRLCEDLAKAGLLKFECEQLITTNRNEFEFFVWMRPCDNSKQVIDSWSFARMKTGRNEQSVRQNRAGRDG